MPRVVTISDVDVQVAICDDGVRSVSLKQVPRFEKSRVQYVGIRTSVHQRGDGLGVASLGGKMHGRTSIGVLLI